MNFAVQYLGKYLSQVDGIFLNEFSKDSPGEPSVSLLVESSIILDDLELTTLAATVDERLLYISSSTSRLHISMRS